MGGAPDGGGLASTAGLPEKYRPYAGPNRLDVTCPRHPRRGHFRAAEHIGRPPSDELWASLTEDLLVGSLRVYAGDDAGDDHLWYACCLWLGDGGVVRDIWLAPNLPVRKAGAVLAK